MPDSEPFFALLELTAPLRAAVSGYRRSLIDLGFSPEASEAMAIQFHALLMAQVQPRPGGQT